MPYPYTNPVVNYSDEELERLRQDYPLSEEEFYQIQQDDPTATRDQYYIQPPVTPEPDIPPPAPPAPPALPPQKQPPPDFEIPLDRGPMPPPGDYTNAPPSPTLPAFEPPLPSAAPAPRAPQVAPPSGPLPTVPPGVLQGLPFGGQGISPAPAQQGFVDQILARLQPQLPAAASVLPPEVRQLLQAESQQRQQFEQATRNQLMELIRQGQAPVSAEQIGESPEAKAFRRVSERAQERFRARAAERRASQGLLGAGVSSGAFQADVAGGEQALQENLARFESQLVARELQQRRQQLMQALSLGAGILGRDQEQALRRELASLDVGIRRELGQQDIGLRRFLGGGQLSLGLLEALLRNQQFYSGLGADVGYRQALLNQGAVQPFL